MPLKFTQNYKQSTTTEDPLPAAMGVGGAWGQTWSMLHIISAKAVSQYL